MGNNNTGRKKREERKRKLAHKQFKRLGVRNNSATAAPIDETDQINPVACGLTGRNVHYSLPISLSEVKSSRYKQWLHYYLSLCWVDAGQAPLQPTT